MVENSIVVICIRCASKHWCCCPSQWLWLFFSWDQDVSLIFKQLITELQANMSGIDTSLIITSAGRMSRRRAAQGASLESTYNLHTHTELFILLQLSAAEKTKNAWVSHSDNVWMSLHLLCFSASLASEPRFYVVLY